MAFSVLPLIVVVTLVFRVKVRRSFRDVRTRLARLNAFLNENLTGMSTVQLLNREARNYAEFRAINAGHRDANLQAILLPRAVLPGARTGRRAGASSLIVWYGGRQVMWTGITLGTLVAFIQYTQRFFRPISDLSEKYNILQQAMASVGAHLRPARHARPTRPRRCPRAGAARGRGPAAAAAASAGRIEFDHVWFAYDGEHWVLRGRLASRSSPARRWRWSGATGSGKTTISEPAAALLRSRSAGAIRVDGRPLRRLGPARAAPPRSGSCCRTCSCSRARIASNLRARRRRACRARRSSAAAREVHADELHRAPAGRLRRRGARARRDASRRASASCWRSPARWPATRSCWSWTRPPRSVDTQTEALIQDGAAPAHAGPHLARDRPPALDHPGRGPHRGAAPRAGARDRAPTPSCWRRGGIYCRLYQLQYLGDRSAAGARAAPRTPDRGLPDHESLTPRLNLA